MSIYLTTMNEGQGTKGQGIFKNINKFIKSMELITFATGSICSPLSCFH